MPEWVKAWWGGLSTQMRWFVMVVVVVLVFFVLGSFVFMGTDWGAPFGWFSGVTL